MAAFNLPEIVSLYSHLPVSDPAHQGKEAALLELVTLVLFQSVDKLASHLGESIGVVLFLGVLVSRGDGVGSYADLRIGRLKGLSLAGILMLFRLSPSLSLLVFQVRPGSFKCILKCSRIKLMLGTRLRDLYLRPGALAAVGRVLWDEGWLSPIAIGRFSLQVVLLCMLLMH